MVDVYVLVFMLGVHCTVYSVHYTYNLFNVQCTLYIKHVVFIGGDWCIYAFIFIFSK